MPDIIKEILVDLPEGKISDAVFEAANIVLYTKDKEFFLNDEGVIRRAVDKVKKRVELRPDPSITLDPEKAEKKIMKIIGDEAGIAQIIFDKERSRVIIEAEKPGLAIGNHGEVLKQIKAETFWVPLIRRTPPIRSKLIEEIRAVLYQYSDYRRKFLNKTGHRIYDGWIREKKHEWIRVTMLGAGRQVGRSCVFLQTPESRILLDCGINVASDKDPYPFLEAPEFNIKDLDAVILSHAHLDHCGMVPYLYKFGYRGPIYMTPPTRDISALLQLDNIKIAKSDGKEPIYDIEDVKEVVKHSITLNYEEVTDVTPDVRITFYNSGHILGSAMVHIHIGNGLHNFLYTGDHKYGKTHLLDPAVTKFPRLETVMTEATYGGKDNVLPPKKECDMQFMSIVQETIKRRGKVLVPVLGVGRAQEVFLLIESMIRNGEMEPIPVFVDGMIWDITAIHSAYPEYLNSTIRKLIFHKDHNPFLSEHFKRVGSKKERLQILEETGPCVILATSGMLNGGPSVWYLTQMCDNPRNTLLFVSYQGEGSLGRRIQRGDKEFNNPYEPRELCPMKMETYTIDGMSGHSGRKQLMNFLANCEPRPKKVIMNHGEATRCLDLASAMHKQFRVETVCPRNLETIRLK
ncbi:beta-CASP ribonuclease aCPSF1 [Candidatus Woesearchaeota archaeon]|nr:MAG: hypothetical protein QS99_C0008G0062 [archaeon GW2011_AR4]MBS3129706.1 beta-CASP ribonuclease aCPSF1 [Candidatus Woesearchaeota archaeon]HIH38810.1 beta-CASP ribonuclease aCPSF1 [Candidatus Woesearchaeota archaeon]HIJ03368.1 beta-CASP ribonuclease aCPSF1 [Candidatus Woesearchaeota archaeon]